MQEVHIAVIVGSLRRDSLNRKLATALSRLAPADFSFTQLQIGDLPLYNQDDDGAGNFGDSNRNFLQSWMDQYVAWVRKHAA